MDILVTRRSFLAGATAFSLSGCIGGRGGFLAGRPDVRLGVVSDIHITDWESAEIFRKTLRWYRDQGVDAVMIVGDIADHGILPQLENVAKAWYEAFPDDRAPDGRRVEKLFVYGNHDIEGLDYDDKWMNAAFARHGITKEQARDLELRKIGLDKAWERCFNEPFAPIYRKTVKGYDFIGGHWDKWNGIGALEDWFKANISSIDTGRPFFYFQHPHPRDTVYGPWAWGHDNGQSTRALARYANAVAFSGHSHNSLTDERSVWRGGFTSIGTASLSYTCLSGPRENASGASWLGRRQMRSLNSISRAAVRGEEGGVPVRQGQLVDIFPDRLVIRRRDFVRDEDLDEAWLLEMPTKECPFSARAARSVAPAFPAGAAVDVSFGRGPDRNGAETDQVTVSFPQAVAEKATRPFDYELTLTARELDVESVVKAFRFYSPTVRLAKSRDAGEPAVFRLARSELPGKAEFRFEVRPLNCYGVKGGPVFSDWMRVPEPRKKA
ncbi:MAG: metallophosphoesterase [Kiritimatiellae bacterium]|nr:metallophosphoesterase [Kiritimatiellia bacterium]